LNNRRLLARPPTLGAGRARRGSAMTAHAVRRRGLGFHRRAGWALLTTWGLLALVGILRKSVGCTGFVAAGARSGGSARSGATRRAAAGKVTTTDSEGRPRFRVSEAAAGEAPAEDATPTSPAEDLFRASARRKKRLGEIRNEQDEREDAAVEALKKAMTSRDIEELELAVKQAEAAGLKASETQDARAIIVQEKGGGLLWVNHAGRRSFEIEWEKGDTVADLKKEIVRVSKVPFGMQVLKSGGADLGEDFRYLEQLPATKNGKIPDVWLFDQRDREDILADEMQGEPFYSDDSDEELPDAATWAGRIILGFIPALYVFTQILGINPFEPEQAGKMVDLPELLGFAEPGTSVSLRKFDPTAEKAPTKIPAPREEEVPMSKQAYSQFQYGAMKLTEKD